MENRLGRSWDVFVNDPKGYSQLFKGKIPKNGHWARRESCPGLSPREFFLGDAQGQRFIHPKKSPKSEFSLFLGSFPGVEAPKIPGFKIVNEPSLGQE